MAMQDAAKHGFDHMPAMGSAIASLIVSPDETFRPDARCPRPPCRVTDDFLSKAYDARAPWAVSAIPPLQQALMDASVLGFSDSSLQAWLS